MRVDFLATHDVHSFYLRWEVAYEGREKALLAALGGPVALEVEASCYVDLQGNRQATARVRIPIWPHAGPRNRGQARFTDEDARRRFWVGLQEAVGRTVVHEIHARPPGSVPAAGITISVPEERPAAPTSSAS